MTWRDPDTRAGESLRANLRISHVTRMNMSASGNPRFTVHFTDDSAHATSSDASVNYDIENFQSRGRPVDIVLTRAGRIIYMRRNQT
jgi:hypothetical protein